MKKSKFVLLSLILIVFLGFSLFFVPVGVKAAGDIWYTPDLTEYTFNIPYDSQDFIFRLDDYKTGSFFGFFTRQTDFGISQNSTGALDFNDIIQTLSWVGNRSLWGYGLTPMISDSLPSYIRYNIYNTTHNSPEYKGAVDKHVITYRLDFLGDYSMLLEENIYAMVYSLEIKFELNIDYDYLFNDDEGIIINWGYTIHYYDTNDMMEYKIYSPMPNDVSSLTFKLRDLKYNAGWNAGYDEGYNEGHQQGRNVGYSEGYDVGYSDGHEVGYDVGYNEGHDVGYSEGYDEGYDIGFEVAQPKMDILLITLIMFILSVFVYFKFRLRWVLIATILLWFVPIFLVENLFIKIFSAIMIIATIVITFFSEREDDYE